MLKIEVSDSKVKPEILIEDVSKAKNVQDSDNPGISRIVIRFKTAAKSKALLRVTATPV